MIDLKDSDIEVREDKRGNKIAWSKSGGGPVGEVDKDTPVTKVKAAKTESKSASEVKEIAPAPDTKTEST